MSTSTPALYHCEAHGRGILSATWSTGRVSREGAGRWVREQMAQSDASDHMLYRIIKITGSAGVVVWLQNHSTHGWITITGRVAGIPISEEMAA